MNNDTELSYNTIEDMASERRFPHLVTIELLTLCNFKCRHCYIPEHNDPGLSYDTLMDVFEQLREMGTFSLALTGGEIFLRKDIMGIVESARRMGFSVSLLSNASKLNEETIRDLAKLHINCFSTTVFSLDGKTNDLITGSTGSLHPLLENIKLLRRYGIRTEVKTPLLTYNAFAYRDISVFCRQNGIKFIPSTAIMPKSNGDRSVELIRLSDDELETVFNELENELTVSDMSDTSLDPDGMPCPSIRNAFSIDCKGDVYPCNSWFYKVGNILDNSLEHIWNHSDEYKKLNSIRNRDLAECIDCSLKSFCTRCPGHALLEDGNMLGCSTMDRRYAGLLAQKKQSDIVK